MRKFILVVLALMLPSVAWASRDSTAADTTVFKRGKTLLPRSTVKATPEDSVKWGTWANPFESVTSDTSVSKRFSKNSRGKTDTLATDSLSVKIAKMQRTKSDTLATDSLSVSVEKVGTITVTSVFTATGLVDSNDVSKIAPSDVDTANAAWKWAGLNLAPFLSGPHTWTQKTSFAAMPNLPDSGVTFTSDPDTRLAWLGPDSLAVVTGGTSRQMWGSTGNFWLGSFSTLMGTSAGRIGIGTTVPAQKLEISGDAAGGPRIRLANTHATSRNVELQFVYGAAPTVGWELATDWDGNGSDDLNIAHSSATRVMIFAQSTGNVTPGGNKTQNFGSLAAAWDSVVADDLVNVADMPWFDDRDDLSLIKAIRKSAIKDTVSGYTFVDDNTLPKEIMVVRRNSGIDTLLTNKKFRTDTLVVARKDTTYAPVTGEMVVKTVWDTTFKQVLVSADTTITPYAKGDLIIGPDGKPFYSVRNAFGLLFGAVKQLDAERSGLSAWVLSLQKRLESIEAKVGP